MEAQTAVSNSSQCGQQSVSTQCGLFLGEYKKYNMVSGVTFSFKALNFLEAELHVYLQVR